MFLLEFCVMMLKVLLTHKVYTVEYNPYEHAQVSRYIVV